MSNSLSIPRSAEAELADWLTRPTRKPLVLRGARQVGKSHLVRRFAAAHGLDLHEVNLEVESGLESLLATRDPGRILSALEGKLRASIRPPRSLLFLDEIQAMPVALSALRYFFEQVPELPVLAAGSLLDFALAEPEHSVPVGRIEYLHLGPLTFAEFLVAQGHGRLLDLLRGFSPGERIESVLHEELLRLTREYMVVGGMPRAVVAHVTTGSAMEVEREKQAILTTFLDDVAKYQARVQPERVRKVFRALPRLVAQRFRYTLVDREERARDLGRALDQLCMARVAYRVLRSSCSGVPLGAQVDERFFKLLFLDVGLVSSATGLGLLDLETSPDLVSVQQGALVEQMVGQELLATLPTWEPPALHYWSREARNSAAEVDYVVASGPRLVPVEVKAGKTGRLRSLHVYAQEKRPELAVRLWSAPPQVETLEARILGHRPPHQFKLLSLPLYMAGEVRRVVGMSSSG